MKRTTTNTSSCGEAINGTTLVTPSLLQRTEELLLRATPSVRLSPSLSKKRIRLSLLPTVLQTSTRSIDQTNPFSWVLVLRRGADPRALK